MLTIVFLVLLAQYSYARDDDLYCGACHLLVEEASFAVAQADPKKTIQVGSFRINPDGTQRTNEVPYAGSAVHLTEVMESVCETAKDYMQSKGTKRTTYVRQNSRRAAPGDIKNLVMNTDMSKRLRFACDNIIEEHEDELIKMFVGDRANLLQNVCVDLTGVCTKEQLYDVNEQPEEIKELHKSYPKNRAAAADKEQVAEDNAQAAAADKEQVAEDKAQAAEAGADPSRSEL